MEPEALKCAAGGPDPSENHMLAIQGARFGRRALAFVLVSAFILGIGRAPAAAGPLTFVKVAAELDPAPFRGRFRVGFGIPAVDAGLVAFTGFQVAPPFTPQGALYDYSAGLLGRIAAVGDPAPGATIYTDFSTDAPSVDSGKVAYMAGTTGGQG